MENTNDVENKIFLSVKEKAKTISSEELEKIISDDLKTNGYVDWQVGYAVERIKKMVKKENNPNESKKIFGFTAYTFGLIVVFILAKSLVTGIINSQNSTPKLISNAVQQIKSTMKLPYKVDAVTTALDITAEEKAVRYHYMISGFDSSSLTNDQLKTALLPGICQNEDEKKLLNEYGINIEYSYVVKDSPQTFFITFTKEDCLNYQIPTLKNYDDLKPIKLESK